jgi:hypothetical protein
LGGDALELLNVTFLTFLFCLLVLRFFIADFGAKPIADFGAELNLVFESPRTSSSIT